MKDCYLTAVASGCIGLLQTTACYRALSVCEIHSRQSEQHGEKERHLDEVISGRHYPH